MRNDLAPKVREAVERLAYSPAQAAESIGISRAKLYQLIETGELPSVKLGSRRLVRRESLVAFLAALESSEVA